MIKDKQSNLLIFKWDKKRSVESLIKIERENYS